MLLEQNTNFKSSRKKKEKHLGTYPLQMASEKKSMMTKQDKRRKKKFKLEPLRVNAKKRVTKSSNHMIENERSEVALIQTNTNTHMRTNLEYKWEKNAAQSQSWVILHLFRFLWNGAMHSVEFLHLVFLCVSYWLAVLRARFSPLFCYTRNQHNSVFSLFNRLYLCTRAHDSFSGVWLYFRIFISSPGTDIRTHNQYTQTNCDCVWKKSKHWLSLPVWKSFFIVLSGLTICLNKSETFVMMFYIV